MFGKRAAITLVAVALLVGLAGFFLIFWPRLKRPAPRFETSTIVKQVQGLSHLVTVQYVMEKVVVLEDPKFFGLIPLGENRLILLAHGIVKAGVDLSKVKEDQVKVSGEKITVQIPPAVLTDAYLVEGKTQVLDWRTGVFRTFDKTMEQQARAHAVTEIQRAARQSGIEEQAHDRARAQLTNLLQLLGFKEVVVETYR